MKENRDGVDDENHSSSDDDDIVVDGAGGGGGGGDVGGNRRRKKKRSNGIASRALNAKDALALTLFILRTGSTSRLAGSLFGVKPHTVTRYFSTWVCYLSRFLDAMFP